VNETILILLLSASTAFFHTILGPDHYLPFILMSKSRKWSGTKTIWITFICGIGHLVGSIVLGIVGIALGVAITKIEYFESVRGELAAWLLIGFGFTYLVWGLHRAYKKSHSHGIFFKHKHSHKHVDNNFQKNDSKSLTSWTLFLIFALGPCEPLIPILMYPAAKSSYFTVILVTLVFGFVTILTMMSMVAISIFGIQRIQLNRVEQYMHAIAGGTIMASGMAIQFLGL